MTLEGAYSLLAGLLERMPARHPKPRLVVHESAEAMVEFLGDARHEFTVGNGYPPALVLAIADPHRNTIHLPYPTLREPDELLLNTLLHELGHLYYSKQHGNDSPESNSEDLANAFARRWTRLLVRGERRKAKRAARRGRR